MRRCAFTGCLAIGLTFSSIALSRDGSTSPYAFEGGIPAAESAKQARDDADFQRAAIVTSPAMFRRTPGAGSLYWLAARDGTGAYLDGGKSYRLSIPQPVPGKLFWSVTAYDAQTRSEVQTDQGKAALRSMFELKDASGAAPLDLFFGPTPPAGNEGRWIKTVPGRGWFAYLRIYGPEKPAFDGSWKAGDFREIQ